MCTHFDTLIHILWQFRVQFTYKYISLHISRALTSWAQGTVCTEFQNSFRIKYLFLTNKVTTNLGKIMESYMNIWSYMLFDLNTLFYYLGPQGALFEHSVQTPLVKAEPLKDLRWVCDNWLNMEQAFIFANVRFKVCWKWLEFKIDGCYFFFYN